MQSKARAFVNIALIKYWGKKDRLLRIPYQSSLSLTIDNFYTDTHVVYDEKLTQDVLTIDGKIIVDDEFFRVKSWMDMLREKYHIPYYAHINSFNHVPKKAGLASSASAFAALTKAATKAFDIELDDTELSRLARLGSGSASRSIFGGFSIWHHGNNHESSYAQYLGDWSDFRMLVCLVSGDEKKVGSGDAMEISQKQPIFKTWVKQAEIDLKEALDALDKHNFSRLGKVAESNALLMHDVINRAGINYLNASSQALIELTQDLRKKGYPVYATMDAGPNVKVMTLSSYVEEVLPHYEKLTKVYIAKPGSGVLCID